MEVFKSDTAGLSIFSVNTARHRRRLGPGFGGTKIHEFWRMGRKMCLSLCILD